MEQLEERLHKVQLAEPGVEVSTSTSNKVLKEDDEDGVNEKWGMNLQDLYRLGVGFFKEKSGKAIHIGYEDNLRLIAFTQQASHGPLDVATVAPLGVLDVIGRDRRLAWQNLGSISRAQAKEGFLDLLDRLCPLFKPFLEAIKKDLEEKQRLAIEQEQIRIEAQENEKRRDEEQRKVEEKRNLEEHQRRQLQDALNQQTFHQFKSYAEKQYPGNPDEQAVLIRQLQTEHYHQYMQQLQAMVVSDTVESKSCVTGGCGTSDPTHSCGPLCKLCDEMEPSADNDIASFDFQSISPAKMWTRSDMEGFKEEVRANKGDGVLLLNHGSTITVRVPTRDDGLSLYWEFASDSYDIAFGVYFEWGKAEDTEVSVLISDSEDDEDEIPFRNDPQQGDVEGGAIEKAVPEPESDAKTPFTTSIIPSYRRDCHKEVYVGMHPYPGDGVYLLKFDNSFSMWRSKTIYYKIYYSRG